MCSGGAERPSELLWHAFYPAPHPAMPNITHTTALCERGDIRGSQWYSQERELLEGLQILGRTRDHRNVSNESRSHLMAGNGLKPISREVYGLCGPGAPVRSRHHWVRGHVDGEHVVWRRWDPLPWPFSAVSRKVILLACLFIYVKLSNEDGQGKFKNFLTVYVASRCLDNVNLKEQAL